MIRALTRQFSLWPHIAAAVLVLAAALLATRPATAEMPGPADQAEIRAVISAQIEAFRGDRAGEAYSYASPTIRGIFPTADIFLDMVRTGYQPVYRPREVEFRELIEDPELGLVQKVLLVGPDGVPVMAHYQMQRQPDGSWKINGCRLHQADGASA